MGSNTSKSTSALRADSAIPSSRRATFAASKAYIGGTKRRSGSAFVAMPKSDPFWRTGVATSPWWQISPRCRGMVTSNAPT